MSKTVFYPSVEELSEEFSGHVVDAGGEVSQRFLFEDSLYIRAILDLSQDVFPHDAVDSGIALRVVGPNVSIHPYTFRRICQNGAISSRSEWSVNMLRPEFGDGFECQKLLADMHDSIDALVDGQPFAECLVEMRQANSIQLDLLSNVIQILVPLADSPETVSAILNQFLQGEPQTGFGLMNAITAVARVEPEPEVKWMLEEVGGGIPARLLKLPEFGHIKEAKQIPQPVA